MIWIVVVIRTAFGENAGTKALALASDHHRLSTVCAFEMNAHFAT